tara:strand:- start:22454 stop:23866 length:1413 start_codon:yes stop_codon:yes gene_type:complete
MNINECYEYIQLIANKEEGGYISPEDFGTAIDAAQMEFFNDRYGQPATYQPGRPVPIVGYPQSQKVHDDISVCLTHERVYFDGVNPYVDLKDGEYLHLVAAYYRKNTGYQDYPIHSKETYPLDVEEYDQSLQNINSTMLAPEPNSPRLSVGADGRYFFKGVSFDDKVNPYSEDFLSTNKNNGDEVYLVYLRRPQKPVWNYMFDETGRPVYSKDLGVIPVKQIGLSLFEDNAVVINETVEQEDGSSVDVQVQDSSISGELEFSGKKHHESSMGALYFPESGAFNIYSNDEDGNLIYNNNPSQGTSDGEIIEFTITFVDGGSITTSLGADDSNTVYVINNDYQINFLNYSGVNNEEIYQESNGGLFQPRLIPANPYRGYLKLSNQVGASTHKLVFRNSLDGSGKYRINVQTNGAGLKIEDLKRYTTGSVDLELPQQTHLEICMRALGYLGINLSDQQLVQYAEGKQTNTPGV